VIDLLDGLVVHAQRGERSSYRALQSPLIASATPQAVLNGYLSLYPFNACYVADLNALMQDGHSDHDIAALVTKNHSIEFWIDAAFGERTQLPAYVAYLNVRCIIGTESLASLQGYETLRDKLSQHNEPVLSLDFRGEDFIGPTELFKSANQWPEHVIAMNLARVGSGEGPDITLLTRLRHLAPTAAICAAGGVRDANDLSHLQGIGVTHVLLATALHRGTVTAADLARFTI
jgi:uncharacterized protein related to proFAR isomerase